MVLVALNDGTECGISTLLMSKVELAFVTIVSSRMLWGANWKACSLLKLLNTSVKILWSFVYLN